LIVSILVRLEKVGDLGHERIIGVGVGQQGADGEEYLGDGKSGGPLILEDVEADGTVAVNIAVVDFRSESNLGRLEWVIGREVDIEEENALVVWGVLGAHDSCLPVELVLLVGGSSRAVSRRVTT